MKKPLLLVAFVALCFSAAAQNCTPTWPVGAGPGILPDSATNLPIGYEQVPYAAEVQFRTPLDTTAVVSGFSVPITVQNITVESVSGLNTIPASSPFTYVTNPASGVFPGGTNGCVLITGTPAAGSTGIYPIIVDLTANAIVPSLGNLPLAQPITVDYYVIRVWTNVSAEMIDMRNAGLVAVPSLTHGPVSLGYYTGSPATVDVRVVNAVGQVVFSATSASKPGSNALNLDLGALANGTYVVSLQTGQATHTARVVVSK